MNDAPRCPIHHDALYRPLDRGDWVCLSRGCRHRVVGPAPEPTYDHWTKGES